MSPLSPCSAGLPGPWARLSPPGLPTSTRRVWRDALGQRRTSIGATAVVEHKTPTARYPHSALSLLMHKESGICGQLTSRRCFDPAQCGFSETFFCEARRAIHIGVQNWSKVLKRRSLVRETPLSRPSPITPGGRNQCAAPRYASYEVPWLADPLGAADQGLPRAGSRQATASGAVAWLRAGPESG
jgi:hypothetical protein